MNTHFAATNVRVILDPQQISRTVHIPSPEALAWDAPAAATNCAIESNRFPGTYCYAELRITGRGVRKHAGGVRGIAARVRFTGEDDSGAWFSCVVQIAS